MVSFSRRSSLCGWTTKSSIGATRGHHLTITHPSTQDGSRETYRQPHTCTCQLSARPHRTIYGTLIQQRPISRTTGIQQSSNCKNYMFTIKWTFWSRELEKELALSTPCINLILQYLQELGWDDITYLQMPDLSMTRRSVFIKKPKAVLAGLRIYWASSTPLIGSTII